MNLAEALPLEIKRVTKLIEIYTGLPVASGMMGAMMMRNLVEDAVKHSAAGDVVAMLASYQQLKDCEPNITLEDIE